jgi:hypothetical protein
MRRNTPGMGTGARSTHRKSARLHEHNKSIFPHRAGWAAVRKDIFSHCISHWVDSFSRI